MADDLATSRELVIGKETLRNGKKTHLGIEHGDSDRRVLDEQCELGLALSKQSLYTLALRDVVGDFRGACDAASGTSHGRNSDRDIDHPSILGDSYRIKISKELAASDRGKNPLLLLLPLGWDQTPDRLPNHLGRRLAEQTLRTFIPTRDQTVERLADNGIKRRRHDRCETRLQLLKL